jgi:hypothetical protein
LLSAYRLFHAATCIRGAFQGFTSPDGAGESGAGSGTFRTLQARIPFLQNLGITAVWLAGYCKVGGGISLQTKYVLGNCIQCVVKIPFGARDLRHRCFIEKRVC